MLSTPSRVRTRLPALAVIAVLVSPKGRPERRSVAGGTWTASSTWLGTGLAVPGGTVDCVELRVAGSTTGELLPRCQGARRCGDHLDHAHALLNGPRARRLSTGDDMGRRVTHLEPR